MQKTKHLYIHIPFCKSICTYCDFVRFTASDNVMRTYVSKIINEIKRRCKPKQFTTIYIGGGTPNCLSNDLLSKLLHVLRTCLANNYEFTIECNPELLTYEQVKILKANKVNRASIGVQTVNNTLLSKFKRQHTLNDVKKAISNLRKVKIANISIDMIYGFNELTIKDLNSTFAFIKRMRIPHVSWYALEVKFGSMFFQQQYKLSDTTIEQHLKHIISHMDKLGYTRYEVSSWSKKTSFQSAHNKAYWLTKDWKAIGLGACGFENKVYYEYVGSAEKWHKKQIKYKMHDYYFQIMLMGLRLKEGLNLKVITYKRAYEYFKSKLMYVHIIKNHLIADNINLLDNTLVNLF